MTPFLPVSTSKDDMRRHGLWAQQSSGVAKPKGLLRSQGYLSLQNRFPPAFVPRAQLIEETRLSLLRHPPAREQGGDWSGPCGLGTETAWGLACFTTD